MTTLLLKRVRPMGRDALDVLIENGVIARLEPGLVAPDPETTVLDGDDQLLLPGLVNAHAHLDKTLLGLPWHANRVPGARIRDFVDFEREFRAANAVDAGSQSARQLEASLASGVTHVRSHVDIDTEAGLRHLEGVMATREAFAGRMTIQLVAFPQSGMLIRPGTVALLEEAVALGADCVGGLDPSTVDRDPVRHLDTVFAIAERHGVEVDIHLHEPGSLGAFAVELIVERTEALGLQGRVTISHAFCLGMLDDASLEGLVERLLAARIAIMSLGSGRGAFPPLERLHRAGVRLCTGSDGVRDTWGPYNSVDMLKRVETLGYRSGFRKDEEIALVLAMATTGGAEVMGDDAYGLAVGARADLVVLPGDTPAQAVVEQPPRTFVLKGGSLVAAGGVVVAPGGGATSSAASG